MIIEKTGWSRHELLWSVSWINLQMMIADAPALVRKSKNAQKKKVTGKGLADWLRKSKVV